MDNVVDFLNVFSNSSEYRNFVKSRFGGDDIYACADTFNGFVYFESKIDYFVSDSEMKDFLSGCYEIEDVAQALFDGNYELAEDLSNDFGLIDFIKEEFEFDVNEEVMSLVSDLEMFVDSNVSNEFGSSDVEYRFMFEYFYDFDWSKAILSASQKLASKMG